MNTICITAFKLLLTELEKAPRTGRFFFGVFARGSTKWPKLLIICIESLILHSYGELMKRFPVLLMLLAASVQADVYRSVNENGEIIYSDQPTPDAQRINLPELPTYKAPPVPGFSSTPETAPIVSPYKSVKITAPENDATIRDNQGVVRVQVVLAPPLITRQGHKIQFSLNGEPHGIPVGTTSISFSNLDRGTYTLSASVVDANGAVLKTSDPVVFHLHRESVLNPNSPLFKPKPMPLPKS